MTEMLTELAGERLLTWSAEGAAVVSAGDLVGEALGQGATVVAIAAERLPQGFFQLRTGVAGEIAQKIVNYRLKLAVIGDISEPVAASEPLRDWVRECNRGDHIWFEDSHEALLERLKRRRDSTVKT